MSLLHKKNLPKTVKGLSQEQLSLILLKKKECNTRALKIVETLIELNVDKEWMLENLEHINQSHYDDVIEERLILKYCGYPLCSTQLGEIPKQQYRISLARKTVYDITERKKYCSVFCYKSSQYLKSQLLTSPLWYREHEVIPKFKLLKKEPEKTKTVESPTKKEVLKDEGTPVVLPLVTNQTPKNENAFVIKNPVERIEEIIQEWFTVNSFAYLFGEDELRKKFKGKEDIVKSCLTNYSSAGSDFKRFEEISKLFSILNLDNDERGELKPLPDYSTLKEEAEKMNLKIQAFYTGQLVVPTADSKTEEDENVTVEMPLVDNKAQTALRRKVLLHQLNKVVPEMSVNLDLADLVKIADIRCLVRTFSLSPHNVKMKPRELSLISIVILKLLSFKMDQLAIEMNRELPKKRLELFMSSFNLEPNYLENLISRLTDPDRLTKMWSVSD